MIFVLFVKVIMLALSLSLSGVVVRGTVFGKKQPANYSQD